MGWENEAKGKERKKEKKHKKPKKGNTELVLNGPSKADDGMEMRTGKSKGAKKKRKEDRDTMKEGDVLLKEREDTDQDDVYHISSEDEDCSIETKKHHLRRPGWNVLQRRIDDFITSHEARLEQERKEREAQVAEGGWTVVVHHKGRKKTTDSEGGITVGSVAQAAVEEKMTKKKHKEVVGLDFYRFKNREDGRNEILTLQSKFEQDKKRDTAVGSW